MNAVDRYIYNTSYIYQVKHGCGASSNKTHTRENSFILMPFDWGFNEQQPGYEVKKNV
jgi:hypothetical protein